MTVSPKDGIVPVGGFTELQVSFFLVTFDILISAYSGPILYLYWVRLSHPIQCPKFFKKYFRQKWVKMTSIQGVQENKMLFFRKFALKKATHVPSVQNRPCYLELGQICLAFLYQLAVLKGQFYCQIKCYGLHIVSHIFSCVHF